MLIHLWTFKFAQKYENKNPKNVNQKATFSLPVVLLNPVSVPQVKDACR